MRRCEVTVGDRVVSETGAGLLVLLGVARGDAEGEVEWLAEKVLNLRIFPDDEGRMNLSILETAGDIMVVSQFTLLADCRKGRRPSFVCAADPPEAERLYESFAGRLAESGLRVATGVFGGLMDVELTNWGPVTIVLDTL